MKHIFTLFFIVLSFSFGKLYGQNNFSDTSGNIDVDGGGQLQYTLPIALPPGVNQCILTYTM